MFHWVEHHPAHLASTFFVSPFDEAAVCAIDGFGDFVSTSWAVGTRHVARRDPSHVLPALARASSISRSRSTSGFMKFGDEFKVMGLAPYGRPGLRASRSGSSFA